MTRTNALLAAAVLPLLAAPALAQDPTYTEIDDDSMVIEAFGLPVGQLDDMDVHGTDGEKIGEIEDVLMDATGAPVAFALETEGFLGMGDDDVVVTFDQLELQGDRFTTALTEEELGQLPRWDD